MPEIVCMCAECSHATFPARKLDGTCLPCLQSSGDRSLQPHVTEFAGYDEISLKVAAGVHDAATSPVQSIVDNLLAIAGSSSPDGTDAALVTALQQVEDTGDMSAVRGVLRALWQEALSSAASTWRLPALGTVGWHPLARVLPPAGAMLGSACQGGDMDIACGLLGVRGAAAGDVSGAVQEGFWVACREGHTGVVRELLALTGARTVDVRMRRDSTFRGVCKCGHDEIARELLGLTGECRVDVLTNDGEALKAASNCGRYVVVRLLLSLIGDRCSCSQPTCALDSDQLRAVQAALASGVSPAQWGAMGGAGGVIRHPHVQPQLRAAAYRGHRWGVRGGVVAHRAAVRIRH